MRLSIGFSPCPNDTFVFDALVNGKLDCDGLHFDPVLEDIETLNRLGAAGKLDVVKLSFPAFFSSIKDYISLTAGGALGNGVGPLLVSGKDVKIGEVEQRSIAIPGRNTTANFLLSFAFPKANKRIEVVFSQVEAVVLSGKADIGLLIHENRFTYQQKGLIKLLDLGLHWQEQTQLPIPLACIAVKRTISKEVQLKVNGLIRASVEYAWKHYPQLPAFVTEHAQAMDEEVMLKHIDLYVNNFTDDFGSEGRAAIEKLYSIFQRLNRKDLAVEVPNMFIST